MADDILDWLGALPGIEGYPVKDRYHDYRKVFMGSTEGKRVLRHIMKIGGVFNKPALISPIDPYMLAALDGKTRLALEILQIVNEEPSEKPGKRPPTQVRRPGQG